VTEVDKSRSGLACGKTDGEPICVGDEVLVRGVVVRSIVGVGALVRFTSKNEDYQGWIREEDLRWSLSAGAELPPEPADDTWLLVDGVLSSDGNPRIFKRDDAEGHFDLDRRHQQHWFDLVAQEWIDWPTAVQRGATRSGVRRMTVEEE
jgi:hypothetical protein